MADPKRATISTTTSPIRAVAGTLALAGFCLALLVGFGAGNPIEDILARAFVSLLGCLLVGCGVARMCDCVVSGFLADYARERPIPNSSVEVEDLVQQIQTEHEQAQTMLEKSERESKNPD